MRLGVAAAVAGLAWISRTATAQPRLEVSGFVGLDWFGDHTELGNSWAPEQVPTTSSLLGGRVTWLVLPALPADLQLAVEGELAFAPASTGDNTASGRMSYFAPVFAWRAHALLRLARWREIAPHLVLGGGGETVASSSPFMSKETDPVAYWGAGVRVPISAGWHVRLDVRHGVMPARDGGMTSTVELQLGVGATFGQAGATARRLTTSVTSVTPVTPVTPATSVTSATPAGDADRDGDGIVDRLDRCPNERETVNGVADADGCPEADPDGDGIVGDADHCPDEAEDVDGFEDGDGCLDLDNDGDDIADAVDACPAQPETRNGLEDDDGCPDELPAEMTAALATSVRFESGRARVTKVAAAALRPVLAMLQQRAALRLAIAGHGDKANGDALAKRRADAVKWFLVDQGITEDRIVTNVGPEARTAITFELVVPSRP